MAGTQEELIFYLESEGRKVTDVLVWKLSDMKNSHYTGEEKISIQETFNIFVLLSSSTDWIKPTYIREDNHLYPLY